MSYALWFGFYHYALLCTCMLSHVWLFVTPWTVALQAPLSMVILQARILEWVAMPSSRGPSQLRDWTQVSHIVGAFSTIWVTREAPEYWSGSTILYPGELPDPKIRSTSPALAGEFFIAEPPGKLNQRISKLNWTDSQFYHSQGF